jgi:hypothetical protein
VNFECQKGRRGTSLAGLDGGQQEIDDIRGLIGQAWRALQVF